MAKVHLAARTIWFLLAYGGCADIESEPEPEPPATLAIVDGIVDQPAVGFTATTRWGNCTATLISSRVILTAAHCLGFTTGGDRLGLRSLPPSFFDFHSGDVFVATNGPRTQVSELMRFWVASLDFGNGDIAVAELRDDIASDIALPLRLATELPKDGARTVSWGTGAISGTVHCDQGKCGWNPDVVSHPQGMVRQGVSDTWKGLSTAHGHSCPGDSGGPTLNANNEIVGVQSAGSCSSGGADSKGIVPFYAKRISELMAVYGNQQVCELCPRVAFRTEYGNYLQAVGGGGSTLNAHPTWVGEWETFRAVNVGEQWAALQTFDGHFVSALNGGGGTVVADRRRIGDWEAFRVPKFNYYYWQTNLSKQFLSADGGGGGEVVADKSEVGTWETFSIEYQP